MRTATTIEASGGANWQEQADFVVEAERLGLDVCWVAEAWGSDAPSALGYYAARTERILLGSGIMQVGIRTPVAVAQTAIALANLSGGRFLLGLGASGPQVIEGLHGVPFARPLARMRETVQIVREALAGGKISFSGAEFTIPLRGGDAVPMRLSTRAEHPIPVYLAALSPGMLRLTGEIADGWLGTSFIPEAAGAYLTYLDEGLARGGRPRTALDICQGAEVAFAPDEDTLAAMIAGRKKDLAFSLGGMGSATTNFYNQAYSRQGWAEVAAEVRDRWQAGDRDGAANLVTDEMVLATTLIGTEPMVRQRLRAWHRAGVTTVRLYPSGATLDARLATLAKAIAFVQELGDGLLSGILRLPAGPDLQVPKADPPGPDGHIRVSATVTGQRPEQALASSSHARPAPPHRGVTAIRPAPPAAKAEPRSDCPLILLTGRVFFPLLLPTVRAQPGSSEIREYRVRGPPLLFAPVPALRPGGRAEHVTRDLCGLVS